MNATLLDLRRNPGKVLGALDKRDPVILSRRGKPIARIVPLEVAPKGSPRDHEAFGMWRDRPDIGVAAQVRAMRKGRFDDL